MNDTILSEKSWIVIRPFMVTKLNLSGNSLICYAAIYGVTVNKGSFHGSIKYLAAWCNSSEKNIIECLKKLTEAGLVKKIKMPKGNIYIANTEKTYTNNNENTSYEESSRGLIDEESSPILEESSVEWVNKGKSIGEESSHNILDNTLDNNLVTHTRACACENKNNLQNVGELQKYTYNAIATHNAKSEVSRKIPISNSLISFVQKEFRELLEEHRDSLNEVKTAIDNYILVSESDTWKKFYSWRDLIKNFNSYTSEYFDIHKFVSEPESSQKKVSEEYSESLNQEREEIAERERIQNLRDIYEDFTPIRKNFVKDLFEMYQSHGMYNDYSQDDFNLEFAEVADELSNVSSKILKLRFEEYFAHELNIQNLKNVVSHKLINLEE